MKTLAWIFFCFIGTLTSAQDRYVVDSLRSSLKKETNDTLRLLTKSHLAYELLSQSPDSTIALAQAIIAESKKLDFHNGIALGYLRLGLGMDALGKFGEALSAYQDALFLYQQKNNIRGQIAVLNNLGITYGRAGNIPLSLKSSLSCLSLREKINDEKGIAMSKLNIGQTYIKLKKDSLALRFLNESLELKRKIGKKSDEAKVIISLGMAYKNLGLYDDAIKFQQQGLTLSKQIGDRISESYSLNNMGEILLLQGKYDEAIDNFKKSIDIKKERQDHWGLSYSYDGLSRVYQKIGLNSNAIAFAKLGLAESEQIKSPLEAKMLSETLAEALKKDNNFKEALFFNEKAQKLGDSLFTNENARLIATTELYFAMQDKEKELLVIKQEKDLAERQGYFNYIVLVLVSLCLILLLVFSIYVTISLRKERKQKIEIESLNNHLERIVEQRTIKLNERNRQLEQYAFLNAHRLRSPVAAILGLCNLLKISNSESEWKEVLPRLDSSVHELDKIVFEIQRMVDENPVLE